MRSSSAGGWRQGAGGWGGREGSRYILVALIGFFAVAVHAQSPRYKVGRPPTADEVKAWDIAVGPEGKELPPGSGTVERGKVVYAEQCTRCHGATATEG